MDPHMSSVVEDEMRKYEKGVETNAEFVEKMAKEAEVPQNVIHIPRPPPPFPYRLVKKIEDCKYRHFITC